MKAACTSGSLSLGAWKQGFFTGMKNKKPWLQRTSQQQKEGMTGTAEQVFYVNSIFFIKYCWKETRKNFVSRAVFAQASQMYGDVSPMFTSGADV